MGMRRNNKGTPVALASIGILFALAGCAQLVPGQGPAPLLYTLTPKSTYGNDAATVGWQLTLEVPFTSAALNTTRIEVQRSEEHTSVLPTLTRISYDSLCLQK